MKREEIWLNLRKYSLLHRLSGLPIFRQFIQKLNFCLLPSGWKKILRVRGGLGEGLLLKINPRWEWFYWEGTHELPVQKVMGSLLKREAVFFDVGANIGFYSLIAARRGAFVFAFEPDEQHAQILEYHASLNGLGDRISIIKKAVFSYTGEIGLSPANSERGYGNAWVVDVLNAPCRVPSITIDDFASDNPAPDFIKIDVEGAEKEVLKGADRVFRTERPFLVCEVHREEDCEGIEAWLVERGFTVTWLGDQFPWRLFAEPKEGRGSLH